MQEFHDSSASGQFAARDIVNINAALPAPSVDDEFLVPAQRRSLNALVAEIVSNSTEPAPVVWSSVHAALGVRSINEVTISQFSLAEAVLERKLANVRETAVCRALVRQLMKETSEEEKRINLVKYCQVSFGTGRFTELTKSQLQNALSYTRASPPQETVMERKHHSRPWHQIMSEYPGLFLIVFVAGGLVSSLLFV